jgi:hypothetical protein
MQFHGINAEYGLWLIKNNLLHKCMKVTKGGKTRKRKHLEALPLILKE